MSPSPALQLVGTHTRLRTMAPTKPRSRKKGREPRMEVMTIMPPLRRPGHVSIAKYGVTNGAQVHYSQDTAPSAFSQGRSGDPVP